MTYAHGINPNEATMKAFDFKDKFFPGYHWTRQAAIIPTNPGEFRGPGSAKSFGGSESDAARTESMHVDNILAGLRQDDLKKNVLGGAGA